MNIELIKQIIKTAFHETVDLLSREITVAGRECVFYFLDGETNRELLEQDVIRPLLAAERLDWPYLDALTDIVSYSEEIKTCSIDDAPLKIAEGDIGFFIDDDETCYVFSLRKFNMRSVTEPPTSSVLKGPREGFIEEIKTNVTLVRRKIKSPDLVVKQLQIGKYSTTTVAVLYVDGIVAPDVVDEVTKKLEAVEIDGVLDSAYLTSFLESHKFSIFNQVATTEKPDTVAAKLLEGRVAIMTDGSPIVLTVPYVIFEDLQDSYDYYSGDWRASMLRFFRLFGALFTVLLPGAYVALQEFHFHLLPIKFLITLMSATTGIPFPPAIEMLVVLLLFEILNQASLRMPQFMGISLSIVGAIVLGDTAVKAGLISSPAVLVTALSAIGIFCVPDQVGTLSILRFAFLCMSAVLGFLGMIILLIVVVGYLASMEGFGSPYLAPYAPRINPDLKDGLLKDSTAQMLKRPYAIPTSNRTRMRNDNFKELN